MKSNVIVNSNLMSYILSYIDPRYEIFGAKVTSSFVEQRCDYILIMIQTFKCLYETAYLNNVSETVKLVSSRSKFVISLSLCKWSVKMGIEANNKIGSICSIAFCLSKNWPLIQNIVYGYPNWEPSEEDFKYTLKSDNIDQLEWMVSRGLGLTA